MKTIELSEMETIELANLVYEKGKEIGDFLKGHEGALKWSIEGCLRREMDRLRDLHDRIRLLRDEGVPMYGEVK